MEGWGIKEFKAAFFDAEGIKDKVSAARKKVLSKMGAFIRTRAKSSIRKRKKVSAIGDPPSSHEGSLRRLIFFAYDKAVESVVIGPVRFKRGVAPRLLEFSGTDYPPHSRPKTYRARPFMKPAGEAEAPKFQGLLKNMVR